MTKTHRLNRLDHVLTSGADYEQHLTADEWLERFEHMQRDGYFDAEPDFPRALAELRREIQRAKRYARIEPWHPPKYMIFETFRGRRTAADWPSYHVNEKLAAAANWVTGIMLRIHERVPPVSEAEYNLLVEWFAANRERIAQMPHNEFGSIILSKGDTVGFCQIDYMIKNGYRGHDVGRKIDDLRKLKKLVEDSEKN